MDLAKLTPEVIVELLGKHVQNQLPAKQALALAIRNRWRRQQLPKELRDRIKKQNILFKGPTGSGKTALLKAVELELGWPIHFVDITQYTETGYHGKDLEEIISNFVSKYENKKIPKWYTDEREKTRASDTAAKKPVKKKNTNETNLRNLPSAELAELGVKAAVMCLYALGHLTADMDISTDPLLKNTKGDEQRLVDTIRNIDADDMADYMIQMRSAEYKRGKLFPVLSEITPVDIDDAIKYITGEECDITVEAMEYASMDTPNMCKSIIDYKKYAIPVFDSLARQMIINVLSSTSTDKLKENPYAFNMWTLWASVMHDMLINDAGWKPVSVHRIGTKSLNVKSRKAISEYLDIPVGELKNIRNLAQVWHVFAFADKVSEKYGCTRLERTVKLIKECQAKLIHSGNCDNPTTWTLHHFVERVDYDDSITKSDKWVKRVNEDRAVIRKMVKSTTGVAVSKVEGVELWDKLCGCIEQILREFSALTSTDRSDFTNNRFRPARAWDEHLSDLQRHINSMRGWSDGIDEDSTDNSRGDVIEFIQNYGICFIDEIDKIGNDGSSMVSRDGVQRGLLGMVEGADYPIKSTNRLSTAVEYTFNTTNLMFVAAGAFSVLSIDCLIPELRGRFPVVADIHPLTLEDYQYILRMDTSSIHSAIALMGVEGVSVVVTDDGYAAMAQVCETMNSGVNLGARRLESIVDDVFLAPMMNHLPFKDGLVIDAKFVNAITHFHVINEVADATEDKTPQEGL